MSTPDGGIQFEPPGLVLSDSEGAAEVKALLDEMARWELYGGGADVGETNEFKRLRELLKI